MPTEQLYREAAGLWLDRDLEGARRQLETALSESPGPERDDWWFSVSRLAAQIALEADDTETAERHLRRLPGFGIGTAQTQVLRGRLALATGDPERAAGEISTGIGALAMDPSDDVGSLMNGAIALVGGAEVLADLGHARAALDLVERARARTRQAGIADPLIDGALTLVEAQAFSSLGRREDAVRLLGEVDADMSGEARILIEREHARLASGADGAARYAEALRLCDVLHYPAMARAIRQEIEVGPPTLADDPEPVERWAARSLETAIAETRPYALVVRLFYHDDLGAPEALENRIERLLRGDPSLGVLDGVGSDGQAWEVFLDGENPDRLWAAVEPLVAESGLRGEADIRTDLGIRTVRI
jgi:hypothetical protein